MAESTTRTAGAAIVAQLETLGVQRAYLVPGESYLEVLDALHDSPIHTVVCPPCTPHGRTPSRWCCWSG